jgi:hypothetical protein
MLTGLGCVPTLQIAEIGMMSGGVRGPGCREKAVTRCEQTTGNARARCFTAYGCADEVAADQAAEAKRERDNAETRATSEKLEQENAAQPRPLRTCVAATSDSTGTGEVIVTTDEHGLPDRLDPAMISEAVAKVKAQIIACRELSSLKGEVLLSVKVAAEGCVIDVKIKTAPHPALGNCVATAIEKATFAKTTSGGTFRYPFVF